ncbi:MAG: NAD(P)/FAD-dependent oxidoreductase [candidate division Zixibacteria bacterium]|nr:NAD(P)/FAD-dependent oxidoreductase [candidate division Zixibacteria bacterium]MDH3938123.1 NAD(P)/FAD-dependent oxidoreductase [candidate division Zixibacteria bacterium]
MPKNRSKHRVVVVGGGFGGLWATRSLRRSDVEITLVDKRTFHLFQPLLYQVATGGLSPADIASPLRGVLAHQRNVSVKLGEMIGIDFEGQRVLLRDGQLNYDSVIVATGSENHYYGNDQWRGVAPGLKTIEDALRIRNRIYSAFEKAENEADSDERTRLTTFVIIGGGSTGVELAGALGEIAQITLKDNFRSINAADTQVIILEAGEGILAGYDEKLQAAAVKSLSKLGVSVRTGVFAKAIDEEGVTVSEAGRTYCIDSRNVLWAAGIKPSPVGELLVSNENMLDKTGRVLVNPDLSLPNHENVYVIGDLAHVEDDTESPLPGTAPVAMSQGRYVASQITRKLNGQTVRPYRYRNAGQMAVIGRAAAIADLGWARFSGYPAWLLWLFVHLMYLVEYDNRLVVFIQWAWNFFTRNRGARLITYDTQSSNRQLDDDSTRADK